MSLTSCLAVNIPGPKGDPGANGTNGVDGKNAYTTVTVPFVMPAEGNTVDVTVVSNEWAAFGQNVAVGQAGGGAFGYFEVFGKTGTDVVTLLNLENTALGQYLVNSAPGTVFPLASAVAPAGLQGPAGANGTSGAPTTATYLTQTPSGGLSAEQAMSALGNGLVTNTTGTGVQTITPKGIADGNVAPVNNAAGLTAGQAVFATAAGIESKTAANARTALALGTMATQAAGAVAVTGGAINATTVGAVTPSTGQFTDLTAVARLIMTVSGVQLLGAASVVSIAAPKAKVAGNGAPTVLTSTPSIAAASVDGQLLLVQGTDGVNTVTIQDAGSLAGSGVRLGAAGRVLGEGDSLLLSWDATLALWVEVSFTALV